MVRGAGGANLKSLELLDEREATSNREPSNHSSNKSKFSNNKSKRNSKNNSKSNIIARSAAATMARSAISRDKYRG